MVRFHAHPPPMTFPYFSKNGKMLPISEAHVSLSNIEYSYGFGVYETIRVNNKIPYFLKEHLERLELSAKTIGLDHIFNTGQKTEMVSSFIEKISEATFNLKLLLIGAVKKEDAQIFILASSPLFPERKWFKEGIKTITLKYERYWPHAKTLNMLGSYIAYKKAKENGCYDALLINRREEITEGTRTNVYFVKGSTLYSPPSSDILLGVMRMVLLRLIQASKIGFRQVCIPYKDISKFDGAFLTSTSSKILPIKQIDDYYFGEIPSLTRNLMKKLNEYLDMCKGILR